MVPSKSSKVEKDGQNGQNPKVKPCPKVKPWLDEQATENVREYLRFEICDFHCKGLSKTVPLRHRDEILGYVYVKAQPKTWGGWEKNIPFGGCVCVCVFVFQAWNK